MKKVTIAALCFSILLLALPAATQLPPLREAEIIAQLTEDDPVEWLNGVARSLSVPAEERSPEMLAAMIRALEQEVQWDRERSGPSDPSFPDAGEAFGESGAILARTLATTGDPRILPALAWHAYNHGTVARTLFRFGHDAIPHLLAVATSPDATGGIAGAPLWILANIVLVHGPAEFEEELVQATILHLDGPPDHYRSAWTNQDQIISIRQAIALAGVLGTPELVERVERFANSAPEEIERRTGHYVPRPDNIIA